MKINTLIIGAGNISAFYDSPDSKEILTHAHAITLNDQFRLAGFVDVDIEKAKKASDVWGGMAYKSFDEVQEQIDLFCVAVPDRYHYQETKKIVSYNPKMIIIEKPITVDINEGQNLINLLETSNIYAEVNYSRRFIKGFSYLKQYITELGDFLGGTVLYGKGLLHNGSHMVNMLLYLFENMKKISALGKVNDYSKDDCSREVVYDINGKHIIFQPVDSGYVTTFEFDLRFTKGRVKYDGAAEKIYIYNIAESDIYRGERNYVHNKTIEIAPGEAMKNLYLHISNLISGKEKIISSVNDAYNTLLLCKWCE